MGLVSTSVSSPLFASRRCSFLFARRVDLARNKSNDSNELKALVHRRL